MTSGLILFTYIGAHLTNHALGLISLDTAERGTIGLCADAQIEDDGPNMETYHEGTYRCCRVGHADCCPDVRSARERGSLLKRTVRSPRHVRASHRVPPSVVAPRPKRAFGSN
jgi:hypothetical protein